MSFKRLAFEKVWTSGADFPTLEENEAKVREDLQYHPDAIKDFINTVLLPMLEDLGVEKTLCTDDPVRLKYLRLAPDSGLQCSADGEEWKYVDEKEIIPEQEMVFADVGGGLYTHLLTEAEGKADFETHVQVGGTCYVEWDGALYEVVAQEAIISGVTTLALGNLSLGDPANPDTGEPFLIIHFGADPTIGTNDTSASHVVRLYKRTDAAFSPIVKMSKEDGVTTLTITDKTGKHIATILDGEKGEQGPQGEQGPAGADGARGATGVAGEDGTGFVYCTISFSGTSAVATGSIMKFPAARMPRKGDLVLCADGTVWYISGGTWNAVTYRTSTATYTLASTGISLKGAAGEQGPQGEQGLQGEQGPAGADGAKGADGKDGADGYTPVRGTDYWTAEDQAAMVADVLEQLPEGGGTGGSSGETEETLTTILEEQTVEFAGDPVTIEAPTAISVGETYTVVWDGAKYELTAEGASNGEVTMPVLGSAAYATGSEEDNGLPFVIVYAPAELTGTETDQFMMVAITAGTHTVAIYTKAIFPVQTLDGFALNEGFGAYVYTVTPAPFTPAIGDIYTVKWDGGSFSCKVQDASVVGGEGAVALGDMSSFGGVGNGEQFVIGWMQGALLFVGFNTETSHVVGIYSEGGNKPLLPAVDVDDNGKILRVVNGAWTAVALDSAEGASF